MQKKFCIRALALLLSVVVFIGSWPLALASEALGEDLFSSQIILADGTTMTREIFWSTAYSDLRRETYITYTPSARTTPIVVSGESICAKNTLSSFASELSADGLRPVAGINGDYFTVSTGIPLGMVVIDHTLHSSAPSYYSAVGFRPDGSAIIGEPNLSLSGTTGSGIQFSIAGYNKVRSSDGIYLFSDYFGSTTMNTEPGTDLILVPNGPITIGSSISATVEQVIHSTGNLSIPQGRLVLSVNNNAPASAVTLAQNIRVGETITLTAAASEEWNTVSHAVGGLHRLLKSGVVNSSLEPGANPRTAVGIKANGSTIFYTIDGRQSSYSIGASMTQVAQRLLELGCTDAVLLDGGGSTGIGAFLPTNGTFSIQNRTSDGTERAVSNAIFLVTSAPATGTLSYLSLSPYDSILLSGSSVLLSPTGVDTAFYATSLPQDVSFSVTEGGGSVTSSGMFTAGSKTGRSIVTASAAGKSGSVSLLTIETPDAISLSNQNTGEAVSSLSIEHGDSIDLTAAAFWKSLPLTAQESSFSWEADPAIGTIDENGIFRAGSKKASGSIRVTAGACTVSVPVQVQKKVVDLIEDFESGLVSVTGVSGLTAKLEKAGAYVHSGSHALQLSYDLSSGPNTLQAALPLTEEHLFLRLWLYGDGSGNQLSVAIRASETETLLPLTTLDFHGWKQISVPLPAGCQALTALLISPGLSAVPSGTIRVDDIRAVNDYLVDETTPIIKASLSPAGLLTAQLYDSYDGKLLSSNISVKLDGQKQAFSYDETTRTLTAVLPLLDQEYHTIVLSAADRSGNTAYTFLSSGHASFQSSSSVLSYLQGNISPRHIGVNTPPIMGG